MAAHNLNVNADERIGFSVNTLNRFQLQLDNVNVPINCSYIRPNKKFPHSNSKISIMSFNIRSMNSNFDNFKEEVFFRFPCEVIGLCETKKTDESENL